VFGISRQAVYQSVARWEARREELAPVKEKVLYWRQFMPRLGTKKLYRLIKSDLLEAGIKLGRDGLFNYLRKEGLLVKPKKNFTKTTFSKHWMRKHPNLLKDKKITRPGEVLVSDITYVESTEGVHYLSLVTDAYSREIVGHHLSRDMKAVQVVQALRIAVKGNDFYRGAIHHSDRGLQYCSETYQSELSKAGIRPSMTDGYDCYQNALAERVNGILKQEFLIYDCKTFEDLAVLIDESINTYNHLRPHLSLKMKTPNQVRKEKGQLQELA